VSACFAQLRNCAIADAEGKGGHLASRSLGAGPQFLARKMCSVLARQMRFCKCQIAPSEPRPIWAGPLELPGGCSLFALRLAKPPTTRNRPPRCSGKATIASPLPPMTYRQCVPSLVRRGEPISMSSGLNRNRRQRGLFVSSQRH